MSRKRKELKFKGSNLWYLVGLITSDGCLSSDGRHIDITSSNLKFLQGLKRRLGINNRISVKYGGKKQKAFRIQISNKNFYDFLRGIIDGDGGIQKWVHPTNKREQWNLRVTSGSKKFLEWLKDRIERVASVRGRLHCEGQNHFRLKYGKMAARVILEKCYYKGAFGLKRKMELACRCINSYRGWEKSQTILVARND